MQTGYVIGKSPEYQSWITSQNEKSIIQIEYRLNAIARNGHFGDHKPIDKLCNLWELRWKNGRRIYYHQYRMAAKVFLLMGGKKNDQKKDIRKAKNILKKYLS